MGKLLRRKKVLSSVLALLLVVAYQLLTGSDIKTLVPSMTPSPQTAVQGLTTDKQEAKVVKVVDGDTLTVLIAGKKEKVRIIGINTPETVDPRRGVQCFGKEASAFAKKILSEHTVLLESDPTQSNRDKYSRLLRHVWLPEENINVGQLLITQGYANEYTYEIPYKYQQQYKEAEQQAQNAKKGLWADDACLH